MKPFSPSYLSLTPQKIAEKINAVEEIYKNCTLCPHRCRVNRLEGERGVCKSGKYPMVDSFSPHYGEESFLVGEGGSGTIFFYHCNMRCVYCQNFRISQLHLGKEIGYEKLALMMIELQERGCHNINLVSPSHMILPILKSLPLAINKGLNLPLVYNTGGYDKVETLKILENIIDIYLPDYKYTHALTALQLSGTPDYPEEALKAIQEMVRQTGNTQFDETGILVRGTVVRHLILPDNLAGTDKILENIAKISKKLPLNLMDQYHPSMYRGYFPSLKKRVSHGEYLKWVEEAKKKGLNLVN